MTSNVASLAERRRRFIEAYGEHRTQEGHGALGVHELLSLPYLRHGRLAAMWRVRACTYDAFVNLVVTPLTRKLNRSLSVLDAGAGNGWLSYRLCRLGHHSTPFDLRASGGDSLLTAAKYARFLPATLNRTAGDFASLPFGERRFDVVAFNASLHYALDLVQVLSDAVRVLRPEGCIAILDSPFYRSDTDGEAMVDEKRRNAAGMFGPRGDSLLSLPFIEYLTEERLRDASRDMGISWRRHRVRYPLRYELRPIVAAIKRKRPPSRFDLWIGQHG